jgi:hypothetical protein
MLVLLAALWFLWMSILSESFIFFTALQELLALADSGR